MPDITFILADGSERGLEAPEGVSVMAAATGAGVPGIVAECGGSAMCATCHLYLDEAFAERVPPRSDLEDAMLDAAASPVDARSRLGCQIELTEGMDGIVVHLPVSQV